MQCPCGSSISFQQCCLLLINQDNNAQSPEQLMRSRYSAYATEAADYIYQTYAQASRALQTIADISAWAKETKWLKLTIHAASDHTKHNNQTAVSDGNKEHNLPTVCFSAYYQHQGEYFLMKETSRFVVEKGQWRYLEGEVSNNEALIAPKRNQACFCDSNKKFKQCCGR
ncbi:YchJ family protein [Colwellia hornerae]|uniref:SecC motif-containing protein n=1 Tax=Colwellia hornerae TaxID=89402 RepID=A0A5C6QGQ6_9GAMM|nr:YchJ family metal-binding protein [Colwellia hornerae]TWX52814.1 SecC motif-containing protein [Colwellia hornerae]TWX59168.1 SecC motif-containing protein [Colwellia hornerae]TWX68195.1 SecC motif-containing protein [Colwellia hornerae]